MMKLIIGNKNYSSWSLRPWILMRVKDIAFEEEYIPLYLPGSKDNMLVYSPAGKVPILIDHDFSVWDSLAIAEYLAERFPDKNLWPADLRARAHARCISAEMHSGFMALRKSMSMNVRASLPGREQTEDTIADISRIVNIWEDCRKTFGKLGPFLFGEFSIADAFYVPVASRFKTYGIKLSPLCQEYVNTIHDLPAMREWIEASHAEKEVIESFEVK